MVCCGVCVWLVFVVVCACLFCGVVLLCVFWCWCVACVLLSLCVVGFDGVAYWCVFVSC